jgi:hypothetical protein
MVASRVAVALRAFPVSVKVHMLKLDSSDRRDERSESYLQIPEELFPGVFARCEEVGGAGVGK